MLLVNEGLMKWKCLCYSLFFRNTKRNLVYWALGMFLLFSNCSGAGEYYYYKKTPIWWQIRQETIAEVYEVQYQPNTVVRYHFFVDGYKYTGGYAFIGDSPNGFVPGSKYYVTYNPIDPSVNRIIFHKPVFGKDEKVEYAVATVGPKRGPGVLVVPIHVFGSVPILTFNASFEVEGVRYSSVTYYVLNDKNYKPEDINRKKFKVKYWDVNPWRSIILLDEPVNE